MLFAIFGIRTYVPYLLVLVLAHLALAYLIRMVMRRSGVRPWTATAAASLFLLLGSASDDILWAFQIGFVAALVFGFVQLLVADHDGPIDRRDGMALAAGLASLLCSGLGVTMVVVVGIAVFFRRGLRPAALQTAPLAAIYVLWLATYGRKRLHASGRSLTQIPRFIKAMVLTTFGDIGQLAGVGIVLAAILVVGLLLAWRGRPRAELRRWATLPGALLIGSVVFIAIASLGRAGTNDVPFFHAPLAPPRYVYVAAALILPALAVAVDAIGSRLGTWGMLLPLLFLVPIPSNMKSAADRESSHKSEYEQLKVLMLSAAHLPIGRSLPANYVPAPVVGGATTIGWLRSNASSGRVPAPGRLSPTEVADVTQRLVLVPLTLQVVPTGCRVLASRRRRGAVDRRRRPSWSRREEPRRSSYLPDQRTQRQPHERRSALLPHGGALRDQQPQVRGAAGALRRSPSLPLNVVYEDRPGGLGVTSMIRPSDQHVEAHAGSVAGEADDVAGQQQHEAELQRDRPTERMAQAARPHQRGHGHPDGGEHGDGRVGIAAGDPQRDRRTETHERHAELHDPFATRPELQAQPEVPGTGHHDRRHHQCQATSIVAPDGHPDQSEQHRLLGQDGRGCGQRGEQQVAAQRQRDRGDAATPPRARRRR